MSDDIILTYGDLWYKESDEPVDFESFRRRLNEMYEQNPNAQIFQQRFFPLVYDHDSSLADFDRRHGPHDVE